MATAYIEEFDRLAVDASGKPTQIGQQPSIASQTVTYTGTAAASAAFNAATRFVSITADGIYSFKFAGPGGSPTATTSHPRRAAGVVEYFGVHPTGKVSFIVNT